MKTLLVGFWAASLIMSSGGARSEATPADPSSVNASVLAAPQALDVFASLPFPGKPASPGAPYRPEGPFSSWTAEEQSVVPRRIGQLCTLVWIMAHDAPGARFLPAKSPDADETALGVDVCLAGHMPRDWPERTAAIDAANAILQRSRNSGGALVLPASITADVNAEARTAAEGHARAITDPTEVRTVVNRFQKEVRGLGIPAAVESCSLTEQVSVGVRDGEIAYGAACAVRIGARPTKVFVICDSDLSGFGALYSGSFVGSRDWMASFIRKTCF